MLLPRGTAVHAVLIGGEGRILVAGSARIQKEQGHAAFLRQHQHGVGGELAFAYQQGRFVAGDFLHNSHEPRRRGGLLLIFLHNIDNGNTGIVGQIGQRIVVQDNARGKGRSGIFQPGRKPVEAIGIGGGIGGKGGSVAGHEFAQLHGNGARHLGRPAGRCKNVRIQSVGVAVIRLVVRVLHERRQGGNIDGSQNHGQIQTADVLHQHGLHAQTIENDRRGARQLLHVRRTGSIVMRAAGARRNQQVDLYAVHALHNVADKLIDGIGGRQQIECRGTGIHRRQAERHGRSGKTHEDGASMHQQFLGSVGFRKKRGDARGKECGSAT